MDRDGDHIPFSEVGTYPIREGNRYGLSSTVNRRFAGSAKPSNPLDTASG
jgi:hypothetical protein